MRASESGWWKLGPHKESQEDVVWKWQDWTTLNVRFFWTLMPDQVAAVEAASIPPPSGLTMRKLFQQDKGPASEAADRRRLE